jgi:hypothetical protein
VRLIRMMVRLRTMIMRSWRMIVMGSRCSCRRFG